MYRFALILAALMTAGAPGGLLAPPPALAQEQIARVKSSPYDYRDRVIRLAGEAVEVRGVTPVSTQGIYRLVDATDPAGVLIRTSSLPEISGPFTVRARLSEQFLFEGALLLEEIDRDDPFPALPWLPLVVLLGGLAFTSFFLVRFLNARKTERQLHLAPPMWLIPTDQEPGPRSEHGEPGEAVKGQSDPGTPVKFNYRMQFVAEERSAQLDRLKRRSFRAMLGTLALSLAGAGWLVASRAETAGRPTFQLLTPETVVAADTPSDLPADDTLAVPLVSPEPPPAPVVAARTPTPTREQPAVQQPATRTQARVPTTTPPPPPPAAAPRPEAATPPRTPARLPERVGPGAQDSAGQQGRVVTLAPDTGRVVRVTRPVQEPAATPPPAAPPPPPPPPPSPPARDPEAERRAAAEAIQDGVNQLVAAINGRQHDRVATLLPAGGNAQWRTRFLEHLVANETRVESVTIQPATLDAGAAGASASVTLSLRWRANFGVQRSRDATLVAGARQTGGTWRFTGARLLASFP